MAAYAAPISSTAVIFPKLEVKGIVYSRKHPYALINGKAVGEGERIGGVRVVKIQPDKVTVELNGRTKELIFGQ